jgi:Peptidoglycan-synthase activator LpoB
MRLLVLSLLLLPGCKNALQSGQSASLDSFDLQQMTDDMAMKIAADPEVLASFNSAGPLVVVVQPVENRLTGEVIPRGTAEIFTARIRSLLSKSARERFQWVMNRDTFYQLRGRELDGVEIGPSPEAVSPQYALTAIFSNLVNVDPTRRSAYYLCTFQLTNLDDRTILWTDRYEVKKMAVKGFLD